MGGFWKNREKKERKEDKENLFKVFLSNIRTWHLILILIPVLFLTATFLRFDHIKMNELKEVVLTADAAGEDENGNLKEGETQKSQEEITKDITEKLKTLKDFVDTHIVINIVEKNGNNEIVFGTGPFYLEHQYNRLAAAALNEAQQLAAQSSDNNPNGNVYAYANSVCQPQAIANGWHWNSAPFIACMTGEISKYPTSDYISQQITAKIPSTALFRYDFASPIWAPTTSGFFILISLFLIIVIVIRIISWIVINIALKIVK